MNVLLFSREYSQRDDIIMRSLLKHTDSQNIAVCRTLRTLEAHLASQTSRPGIVIISVPDEAELREMVSLGELFSGILMVLMLPDQREEVLTLAHKLRPRFIDFTGNSPDGVLSVIENLARQSESGR